MDIIKNINADTMVILENDELYVMKKIQPEDVPVYKKLKKINNKNIAKIIGFFEYKGYLWVKREYVQGKTIEKYVEENNKRDDNTADKIFLQIISGLKDIHKVGVVHRDLTPKNIIINKDGVAVIIDFGISRLEKENKNTDTEILGTPGYAAPEQFGFSQTTNKSDIYALGVLMNYFKTGKLPNEELAQGKYREIIRNCIQMDSNNRFSDVEMVESYINGGGKLLYYIHKIPGYQSYNIFFEVVATLYYGFILLGVLCSCLLEEDKTEAFKFSLSVIIMLIGPVFAFGDFLQWTEKLKIYKPSLKLIMKFAVSIALIFLAYTIDNTF